MNAKPSSNALLWLAILVGGGLPLLGWWLAGPEGFGVAKCAAATTRHMSIAEQWLVVFSAFGVKPAYMLLSLVWIVWLWRRYEPDLTALRRGLIAFWLGENACTANYLWFGGHADFWEFLHNYGMAVGFAFIVWAVLEAVDRRVIKLSAPKERCAVLNLCKHCVKYESVPCKLQQVFKMLIPATLVIAIVPFCAGIKLVAYDASVLGSTEHYALMASSQLFENYYCPVVAIMLLAAAWVVMEFKKVDPVPLAKVLFAAAVGPLGFGLMRLFLSAVFSGNLLWYVVWEELTELLFVVAVGYVLWIFRHSLFGNIGRDRSPNGPAGDSSAMSETDQHTPTLQQGNIRTDPIGKRRLHRANGPHPAGPLGERSLP